MALTILSVGYPFAPVGPNAVGGAEQILSRIDRALVAQGHKSIVIAPENSDVRGALLSIRSIGAMIDDAVRRVVYAEVRAVLAEALKVFRPSLVHLHGVDFYEYLPASSLPTLVTLHLPITFYPLDMFRIQRKNTFLHCVSESQHRSCLFYHQFDPDYQCGKDLFPRLLPPIPNGVPLPESREVAQDEDFAVCLGRIAPEKNIHAAIEAAQLAGVDLQIAGQVFPYETHQRYFEEQIKPRLTDRYRFVGPVPEKAKWSLLGRARCLLQPSLAAETSSLVAMESLAAGTPVIAFRSGALPEIVEDNRTGFLVESVQEMAAAIRASKRLHREDCRESARTRFRLDGMLERYFALYHAIGTKGP